jgi:18S rRNA (adenine1779-N6/adenine1780-N6)-dimethyltransferase
LGGIFRTKTVLELIEANYKTYRALQLNNGRGVAGGEGGMLGAAAMGKRKKTKGGTRTGLGGGESVDDAMETDDVPNDASSGASPTMSAKEHARQIVEEVLATNAFEQMRSSKMSQDDFLLLLATFNEKGVHFA